MKRATVPNPGDMFVVCFQHLPPIGPMTFPCVLFLDAGEPLLN
jgi:hypothetical protein